MNHSKGQHFVKTTKTDTNYKFKTANTKICTICRERFHSLSKFSLFCNECKEHCERYRFADWLTA